MTILRIAVAGLFFALSAWAQKDTKDIYLDKCSVCHGADGTGKTAKGRKLKVKDVHEAAARMSAPDMIKIVENGKGEMDAFSKVLSKDEIKAVVDYYRSLGK